MGFIKTGKRIINWACKVFVIAFIFYITAWIINFLFNHQWIIFQDNGTTLTLLGILLTFIAITSLLVFKVIKDEIKGEVKEDLERERSISKAEVKISLGVFHMHLYKTLYIEMTQSQDTNGRAFAEIDSAIKKIKEATQCLEREKESSDFYISTLIKNNLAYYLARKWNYYKEGKEDSIFRDYLEKDPEKAKEYTGDRRVAERCIDYLKTTKIYELYPSLYTHIEDTIVWVEKIFSVKPTIR